MGQLEAVCLLMGGALSHLGSVVAVAVVAVVAVALGLHCWFFCCCTQATLRCST